MVVKSSTSPRKDQRDCAKESDAHLSARNGQLKFESCGRSSFGRIPDWFLVRERRTKARILPFVERVLTDLELKVKLDDILDRYIKKWD